jgi:hypothetical protein
MILFFKSLYYSHSQTAKQKIKNTRGHSYSQSAKAQLKQLLKSKNDLSQDQVNKILKLDQSAAQPLIQQPYQSKVFQEDQTSPAN